MQIYFTRLPFTRTILLTVFFLSCLCRQGFSQNQTFDLLDRESLLIWLFDSDSINNANEVLWKPVSFSDIVNSNVSDDGFVHTMLDTILYYTVMGSSHAVAVFETFHYVNGQINTCEECGAQLSAALFDDAGDQRWQIVKFQKHFTTLGTYGMNGEVGITQFGHEEWCLQLGYHWAGQGLYGEYVSFFSLGDFQRKFQFTVHEDNTAKFEFPDPERTYSFDRSMHFIPTVETVSGWWDFDLVTRGTEKDDDIDRAVPANYVTRYEYDWDSDSYVKSCK